MTKAKYSPGAWKSSRPLSEIKEFISYDPDTGIFSRIKKTSRSHGLAANIGSPAPTGYLRISLGGRSYLAHRLAIFWITGAMPPDNMSVDHINGNPADNRAANLRVCPQIDNVKNNRGHARRAAQYKGVQACLKKWTAQITAKKANHYLAFSTPQKKRPAPMTPRRGNITASSRASTSPENSHDRTAQD